MKNPTVLLSSLAIAVGIAQNVWAAPIALCSEQKNCFDFSHTVLSSSSICRPNASCVVQVCMEYTNSPGCIKGGASISHICDSGDANGCLRSPLQFDGSDTQNCGLDGTTVTNKCGDASLGIQLCQEAAAGETVHFVIKDGNIPSNVVPDTFSETGTNNGCGPSLLSCRVAATAGIGNCGNVTAQITKEMVWSYTIPTSACDCGTTSSPSSGPSLAPSPGHTALPSSSPTTSKPTDTPSSAPQATVPPSAGPTQAPTGKPSVEPSTSPITEPTANPSTGPSRVPSAVPTVAPSSSPTTEPSNVSSTEPSATSSPSSGPTELSSEAPSAGPTVKPAPTSEPSAEPSPFCPSGTTLTQIGFDHNRDETEYYSHGDYVKDFGYGFSVSVAPGPGGKPTRKPRIFSSSLNNTADPDLEVNLGNLLIIQEDVQPDEPDDNEDGGSIFFKFGSPTNIKSIGLVDTEERVVLSFVSVYGRERIIPDRIPNGTSQVVEVNKLEVDKLKVHFFGSGVTSFIEICLSMAS